jgi:hypothetical protein
VSSLLIDAHNFDAVAPQIIDQVQAADFVGLDVETEDSRRHEGLNQYCKYNPETGIKAKNTKLVFDMRRTTMTGFSLCTEGNQPIYVNLNHKDFENRVPFDKAYKLLEAKKPDAHWVAHNAPFELTVFKSCYGIDLEKIICTMQMCVSAYGPHEYPHDRWMDAETGAISQLLPKIHQLTANGFDPNKMSPELSDIVYKIIAKESDAAHSWNGYVDELTYGYGLKDAVKSHLGHQMTTFEQVLNGKPHMGELTGAEAAQYGGEDAYWVLPLFRHLLAYMAQVSPGAIDAFFKQENPMIHVLLADLGRTGCG